MEERGPSEERRSSDGSSYADAADDGLLKEYNSDLEAQKESAPLVVEHQVSFRSKMLSLTAYFILNLALTLSNKAVLGKVDGPSFLVQLPS